MIFESVLKKRKLKTVWMMTIMATGILLNPLAAFASVSSNIPSESILNVEMPVIEEDGESSLNFILDPQELLYRTGAARYDGGSVEEGATLLFHNREGQYDFSSNSDRLTIKNKSMVPVTVKISVYITELHEISIREDKDFAEGERCFYLAVVDSRGNEQPISSKGEAFISFDMNAMEENGTCEEYSFGLTGLCNSNANWKGVSESPDIKIMWQIEEKSPIENGQTAEKESGETELPLEPPAKAGPEKIEEPEIKDESAIVEESAVKDEPAAVGESEAGNPTTGETNDHTY